MTSVATKMSVSVGHRLDAQIKCSAPEVEKLNTEQLAALHLFKHEVLGATYRLYLVVPQQMADPILKKFFKIGPDEIAATPIAAAS